MNPSPAPCFSRKLFHDVVIDLQCNFHSTSATRPGPRSVLKTYHLKVSNMRQQELDTTSCQRLHRIFIKDHIAVVNAPFPIQLLGGKKLLNYFQHLKVKDGSCSTVV